ncbi:thiamine pyrophosphate-dependent dehydrogenase E1 component subunit alpha [Otariodibacter oris]|uniref:2-oxoisovalerate dehydrogenase subunit alpha n=1 Tax=Otariodibacter oris TaxID=1032623 RepID=A0A420XG62_9PAST|nr:thiamine pyrophosphate-dependent dehydrogenase E1 component subunit alpha [Otariodibacter oris]QGM79979.1 pyruvate dehydrogenase (acetyl-transferring) E1 component subunit alpha [Otariodibacter oris]RKR71802.1 pyruvate dehydrogenase E1 component alpha subunit [Otariodibacter oris]
MKISNLKFTEITASYGDTFPMYQILDEKGKVVDKDAIKDLTDQELVTLMETITWGRAMDERVILLNRQGALSNYAPGGGQEASQYGSLLALDKKDVFAPTYRDVLVGVKFGMTLTQAFLWYKGHFAGNQYPDDVHMYSPNVIVGGTAIQALGNGIGKRMKGEKQIALALMGDSATSQGDFYEALNFGGVFDAQLVVVVQNNGYGISVPTSKQTKAETLAQKAVAAGIPAIRVDGMDPVAVYYAVKKAREFAIEHGPILIENVTYRFGPHTMSDDPKRYRDDAEVEEWRKKDPLIRLGNYLTEKGLWSKEKVDAIYEEVKNQAKDALAEMAKATPQKISDFLKFMYADQPQNIKEQIAYHEAKEEN